MSEDLTRIEVAATTKELLEAGLRSVLEGRDAEADTSFKAFIEITSKPQEN